MAHDPERKVYIGEVEQRGQTVRFGIKEQDRARHIYVIGQTGTGKSTLLEIMAVQDMANGEGLIFIDPHGQSVEHLLEYVDEGCLDRVIYLAPHLQDCPIGLNIMEDVGYDYRHLVVSSLMASFEKLWGAASWSDRMAYILQNTLLALIEYPGTTLLDVGRMYSSKDFREKVVGNVKDPQVKKYWLDEYANYTERYTQEATPAIQNKLGQFTANPLMRNIIGQPKSAFSFRQVMDEGKVLLINLSKGLIGEGNARMLGVLFTTKIYLDALSRSNLSRQDLASAAPCNFYVDEFQSFANASFAGILSEARKYKLNLVLAHQYIGQLYSDDSGDGNAIRDAVFGNVGTFISFRVGPVDAEIISKQFAPYITEEDLVSLPRRHMYLTLNIDGAGSSPFSARTVTMPDPLPVSLEERVIEQSLQRYGVDRSVVEDMVQKHLEQDRQTAETAGKGGGRRGSVGKGFGKKPIVVGQVRRSAASGLGQSRSGVSQGGGEMEDGSLRKSVQKIFTMKTDKKSSQRSRQGALTDGKLLQRGQQSVPAGGGRAAVSGGTSDGVTEDGDKKYDNTKKEGGIVSPTKEVVAEQDARSGKTAVSHSQPDVSQSHVKSSDGVTEDGDKKYDNTKKEGGIVSPTKEVVAEQDARSGKTAVSHSQPDVSQSHVKSSDGVTEDGDKKYDNTKKEGGIVGPTKEVVAEQDARSGKTAVSHSQPDVSQSHVKSKEPEVLPDIGSDVTPEGKERFVHSDVQSHKSEVLRDAESGKTGVSGSNVTHEKTHVVRGGGGGGGGGVSRQQSVRSDVRRSSDTKKGGGRNEFRATSQRDGSVGAEKGVFRDDRRQHAGQKDGGGLVGKQKGAGDFVVRGNREKYSSGGGKKKGKSGERRAPGVTRDGAGHAAGKSRGGSGDRTNEKKSYANFGESTRAVQSAGFAKDFRVPKKKKDSLPAPVSSGDGWVSLTDLGKVLKDGSEKSEGDAPS